MQPLAFQRALQEVTVSSPGRDQKGRLQQEGREEEKGREALRRKAAQVTEGPSQPPWLWSAASWLLLLPSQPHPPPAVCPSFI
jgi:hypothetical protein